MSDRLSRPVPRAGGDDDQRSHGLTIVAVLLIIAAIGCITAGVPLWPG
jgi:hypothetical protein